MQYYYKLNKCKAEQAYDSDCICWHEEGTGPAVNERGEYRLDGLTMREKPVKIISKHEQALRDIKKHMDERGPNIKRDIYGLVYDMVERALEE